MSDTHNGREYQCPYPDCDWTPSRPINSDVRLTQVIVNKEVNDHREAHHD